MNFKIINNFSNNLNHSTRLKELFNKSDNVILVSPFLMINFSDFLRNVSLSTTKRIHLITTLKPKTLDQIRKVTSLISLINYPEIKNKIIQCKISINNKLHGKIYIFKKDGAYISAIISSANFTNNGLISNNEWGVEFSNEKEISLLETSIINSIEFENLQFDDIYSMQKKINNYLVNHPNSKESEIDLKLTDLISSPQWLLELDDTTEFWLKPLGSTSNPVAEGNLYNDENTMLNFSKIKPKGVKLNNILIAYGVGTTKILAIYRVTSSPKLVTDLQIQKNDLFKRWPWYVNGHNLTPKYGSSWWTHNLNINTLKNDYLCDRPDAPITAIGGNTLGALQFGKDKLKLTPDFAKFIINKVVNINDN
jgi:HKD family nuclease